jgi:hypothetical protein
MGRFRAEVVFDFEAETLEGAGAELRRLADAAAEVGFHLRTGRVEPRGCDEDAERGTPYGPEE